MTRREKRALIAYMEQHGIAVLPEARAAVDRMRQDVR